MAEWVEEWRGSGITAGGVYELEYTGDGMFWLPPDPETAAFVIAGRPDVDVLGHDLDLSGDLHVKIVPTHTGARSIGQAVPTTLQLPSSDDVLEPSVNLGAAFNLAGAETVVRLHRFRYLGPASEADQQKARDLSERVREDPGAGELRDTVDQGLETVERTAGGLGLLSALSLVVVVLMTAGVLSLPVGD